MSHNLYLVLDGVNVDFPYQTSTAESWTALGEATSLEGKAAIEAFEKVISNKLAPVQGLLDALRSLESRRMGMSYSTVSRRYDIIKELEEKSPINLESIERFRHKLKLAKTIRLCVN